MIFDDDADILEVCTIALEADGYEVTGYHDCSSVLNKVRDCRPDVILMDNKIPDIGGVAATRLIKESPDLAQIPVIFFTANNEAGRLAGEAAADYFMEKPFELGQLPAMVSRAISVRSTK